jgi:hypothetical protein
MSFQPPSKEELRKRYAISEEDFQVLVCDNVDPRQMAEEGAWLQFLVIHSEIELAIPHLSLHSNSSENASDFKV